MFRQRNKTKPRRIKSKVEIGNLPEKEFRVMIVKMIQDLRKKKMETQIKKLQEEFLSWLSG